MAAGPWLAGRLEKLREILGCNIPKVGELTCLLPGNVLTGELAPCARLMMIIHQPNLRLLDDEQREEFRNRILQKIEWVDLCFTNNRPLGTLEVTPPAWEARDSCHF